MKRLTIIAAMTVFALLAIGLTACGGSGGRSAAAKQAEQNRRDFVPYIPHNGVEGANYNKAQELADNSSTIIWCTVMPQSSTAPVVTIPIAGKLTSSTVSAFSSVDGNGYPKASVDGLYHNSPPPYRYGFTPGGQYVEFDGTNGPICTTAVNEFQRQSISVKLDSGLTNATKRAEKALSEGKNAEAQQILQTAAGQ